MKGDNDVTILSVIEIKTHPRHIIITRFSWWEIVFCIPVIVFTIWASLTLRWVKVTGTSMEPTIKNGTVLLVTRRFKDLDRGDIVVVKGPTDSESFTHRVLCLPGELAKLEDGSKYLLPKDEFFIRGDNKSSDEGIYTRHDITEKLVWVFPFRIFSLSPGYTHSDVQAGVDDTSPAWNSTGTMIAFIRDGGKKNLNLITMEGGKPQIINLCQIGDIVSYLHWKGNKICWYDVKKLTWFEMDVRGNSKPHQTVLPEYHEPVYQKSIFEGKKIRLFKHPRKKLWICSRQVPVGNTTPLRLFLYTGSVWTQITNG